MLHLLTRLADAVADAFGEPLPAATTTCPGDTWLRVILPDRTPAEIALLADPYLTTLTGRF